MTSQANVKSRTNGSKFDIDIYSSKEEMSRNDRFMRIDFLFAFFFFNSFIFASSKLNRMIEYNF